MSRDNVKQILHALEAVVDDLDYVKGHPIVKTLWDALKGTLLSDAVIDAIWARFGPDAPVA